MYFLPHHQFKLDRLNKEANECTILFSRGGWGQGKGPGSACTARVLGEGKWEQIWELSRKNTMSTWGVLHDIILV